MCSEGKEMCKVVVLLIQFSVLLFWRSRWILSLLGSFSNDIGDGNESVKKAIGSLSKTTLHVQHAFFVYFFAVTVRLRRENV